jgi:hypothetical protein
VLNYFAGPIEIQLPTEVVIVGLLIGLAAYSVAVFVSSWLIAKLVEFYAKNYAPDTKFSQELRSNGRKKSFALYLVTISFVSTLVLLYGAWPYFDKLGGIIGIVLFTLTVLMVPTYISILVFTIRNK